MKWLIKNEANKKKSELKAAGTPIINFVNLFKLIKNVYLNQIIAVLTAIFIVSQKFISSPVKVCV